MTNIQHLNGTKSVPAGPVGVVPDLLRTELARMNDQQLRRLLLWLDQRGAVEGRSFAVHQSDPRDPSSRELVEVRLGAARASRHKEKLRLPRLTHLVARQT